jgi:hypothetical protein
MANSRKPPRQSLGAHAPIQADRLEIAPSAKRARNIAANSDAQTPARHPTEGNMSGQAYLITLFLAVLPAFAALQGAIA